MPLNYEILHRNKHKTPDQKARSCEGVQQNNPLSSAETQEAPTPAHRNEALTLLTLQQQVLQLTAARATLDEVLELVHKTPLCNLASAQDRRTLNTAQSCLDSLRIRLEAHANSVEDTVRQKQVSLVLRQRQEAAVATELPTDVSAKHNPGLPLQTSTRSGPTAVDERGSVFNPR